MDVVDGADVNPPSADAGLDPCFSNHDVLPVVPVVPDLPVSTEAMSFPFVKQKLEYQSASDLNIVNHVIDAFII